MGRITTLKGRTGFYIEWGDANGRRRRKRVHGSRADARKLLSAVELQADRERLGIAAPATVRNVTIEQVVTDWLTHVGARRRPRTVELYRRGLTTVFDWLDRRGCRLGIVADLNEADLTAAAVAARDTLELAAQTVNGYVHPLRSALRWAHRRGMIARNPLAEWEPLPVEAKATRRALSAYEIAQLLMHSPEPLADIWRLVLGTAIRSGEARQIEWRDIDWDAPTLTIRAEIAKTRRPRIIPLRSDLIRVLQRQRRRNIAAAYRGPLVFITPAKGVPWGDGRLAQAMHKCSKAAGITDKIDVHTLRHTSATAMLAAGGDLKAVQHILGHTTATMTLDQYAHVINANIAAAVALVPLPGADDLPESARRTRAVGE